LRDQVPEFHGSTPVPLTLHLAAAADSTAAHMLALTVLGDAPHAEPMLAALDHALIRASDEYRAIVARDGRTLVGVIVFGEVAGARGAGRIYLVAVDGAARRRGIATALINEACRELAERRARFAMIELPAHARLASVRRIIERAGFREDGRMDDYVRDGVPLLFLRRQLELS
jgi:ribosomal protein S18 acetylase RimI-like enzyme